MSSKKQLASYTILKVARNSTPAEIKGAFLRLSKIYHPDNSETGDHAKFLRIKTAFDSIRDAPLSPKRFNSQNSLGDGPNADLSHKAHIEFRAQTNSEVSYHPGATRGPVYSAKRGDLNLFSFWNFISSPSNNKDDNHIGPGNYDDSKEKF